MGITFEQFGILVKAMKAVYTDPKFIPDTDAMKTWYAMLNDLTYKQLSEAIKAYMQTNPYTPTIAGIRSMAKEVQPEGLNTQEAWGLVRRALSRSGYYYQDEYDNLPIEVQKAVGLPENLRDWSQLDTGTLDSVIYSQFIKSFTGVQKRQGFTAQLSGDMKERLRLNTMERIRSLQIEDTASREKAEITADIEERLEKVYRRLGA